MLKLTGFAVNEFLQGYVTCNTERINTAECTAFAACSLQGRVVANGWALELADGIGLVVHRSIAQVLRDYLQPYLQFSKCKLTESEDSVYVARASNDLGARFLPEWNVVVETGQSTAAINGDASAQINECLIEHKMVLLQQPCSSQHLPQMLDLEKHGAIDFDKGCYLGQEVVARAQFRGAVKRGLAEFDLPADQTVAVELGQSLTHENTKGDVVMIGNQKGLWVTKL